MTTDKGANNISSYTYTYDKVDNRLSMTDNHGTHTYQYDDVYQLANATHPQAYNPDENYTFDPVGNRLTSHLSSAYVYGSTNMLQEDDQYTYSYDDNGNLISKVDKTTSETTTYQYDGENRLIQVATPTDFVLYQYDGFGRRIAKTVNEVVTKYVYDREDILFELDENDQVKAIYTHGPGIDEPISVDRDTDSNGTLDTTYYYNYDGLGSVTAITDSSGNVVQNYEYDTFGKIVNQTGSVENSYTYTGREWNAESGLYFYRARYYDPTIGRFINADPIGFAGGDVNFYVYVQNNPVNWNDPVGLLTFQIGFSGTGGYGVGATSGLGFVFGFSWEDGFQFGTYDVIGIGGYAGAGASAVIDFTVSGNKCINQLEGITGTAGGSAKIPFFGLNVGGETNIPIFGNKTAPSYTGSVGVGVGTPEGHGFITYTTINEWTETNCDCE